MAALADIQDVEKFFDAIEKFFDAIEKFFDAKAIEKFDRKIHRKIRPAGGMSELLVFVVGSLIFGGVHFNLMNQFRKKSPHLY